MRLLSPLRAGLPMHRRFGGPGCLWEALPGGGSRGCDSALDHPYRAKRAHVQQVCAWTRTITRRNLQCGKRGSASDAVRMRGGCSWV